MKQIPVATLSFIAGWTCAASMTFWVISKEELPTHIERPIAHVAQKKGNLDYRPEDDVLWRSAGLSQAFAKGTRLATGKGSQAVIRLDDGRDLVIDAESLVVLSKENPLSSTDNSAFIVTLSKGTVAVREKTSVQMGKKVDSVTPISSKSPVSKIVLKTNDKVVTLNDHKSEVVLEKKTIDAPVTIASSKGAVEAKAPVPEEKKPKEVLAPLRLSPLKGMTSGILNQSPEVLKKENPIVGPQLPDISTQPKIQHPNLPEIQLPASGPVRLPIASETQKDLEKMPDPIPHQVGKEPAAAKDATESDTSKSTYPTVASPSEESLPHLVIDGLINPSQLSYWNFSTSNSRPAGLSVILTVSSPSGTWEQNWTPLISATLEEEKKDKVNVVFRGLPMNKVGNTYKRQEIEIPLNAFSRGFDKQIGMSTLTLRAGVEWILNGKKSILLTKQNGVSIRLYNWRSLAGIPASLWLESSVLRGMSSSTNSMMENPLLRELRSSQIDKISNHLRIDLRDGSQVIKLASLVARSKRFRIEFLNEQNPPPRSYQGITMIRLHQVQATMYGPQQWSSENISFEDFGIVLSERLGSDLAYLGNPDVFLNDSKTFKLKSAEHPLFVINKTHGLATYTFSKIAFDQYSSVRRFILANSHATFLKPVRVIHIKDQLRNIEKQKADNEPIITTN